MIALPDGSLYFWMYSQGLKHVPLDHILAACSTHGRDVREKDVQNYWNGWYRSELYAGKRDVFRFQDVRLQPAKTYFDMAYQDYERHPFLGQPEIEKRFVPCSDSNKPMIKWGDGCLSRVDALAYPGATYLGENLKGCKFIVFDCDGDHDDELDLETIDFMYQFSGMTNTLVKPKTVSMYDGYGDDRMHSNVPASFHLTFRVDRLVPTMHFPKAHIDIVGNQRNSLRYFKNKVSNGKEPADMTAEVWEMFKGYIRKREEG